MKPRSLSVICRRIGRINALQEKDQSRAIDMFNKLAGVTAGAIVRTAPGSARHMAANRHDIAARLDPSIPSQWH